MTCHNEKLKTANLLLDKADADQVFNSAETWEKVIVQLRARSMPPPGSRRPDSATYDATAAWLEGELDREAAAHPNPGRPADLHRLNRTEYSNAIRDLLDVEINGTAMLPPDEQAHGFDNNADALTVVPALLDRYLASAAKISRLAVGDPTIRPAFERYTAIANNSNERTWLWQTERLGEEFPLGSRGGIAARHYFPLDGEYIFRVRLDRTYTGLIRGLHVPNEIEIRVDGQRVGQFTLGGQPELRASASLDANASNPLFTADEVLEVRVPVKAGLREVTVTAVRTDAVKPEGLGPARIPIWGHDYDGDIRAPMVVSLLFIGGPYNGRVPQDSPSRRRIFVCQPGLRAKRSARSRRSRGGGGRSRRRPRAPRRFCRRSRDARTGGSRRPTTSRRCSGSSRAAAPTEISTQASGSRSSGCSSAPIFCFASRRIPPSLQAGRAIPPLRRRAGIAPVVLPVEQHSRTMSCSISRFAASCATPACSIGRCGVCSPIHARARRWWRTSSASGCRYATCGC